MTRIELNPHVLLIPRSGSIALLWLCLFLFAFSIGLGPGTFVVASEIVPLSARSKTMGVVVCCNRLGTLEEQTACGSICEKGNNLHLIN